ncbi:MAG: DUF359 domain-containing protein, partial [Thermoplasmata archaeon]|nr:DUF359 domain-containing protein [Thermoplasmata archaeon]
MPPAGTRSGSSDEPVWVVPPSLRERLSERYGPVYSGLEAEQRLRALSVFACCGDRVTETAIRIGHLPLLGVVDFKTQRHESIDPSVFEPLRRIRSLRVRNPAGMLTGRLRSAVRDLVDAGGGLLEVEGEELVELAPLPVGESGPACDSDFFCRTNQAPAARPFIDALFDRGSFFELRPDFAPSLVTGLA